MSLLQVIVKRLRQVAFSFREKPASQVEEFVLEHFLVYHGLVGTSPDNRRSFHDVKDEVHQAIANGSSLQLGIALKLQPLWWEEKLKTIFSQLDAGVVVPILLPELSESVWPDQSDPLGHPDWRVRANAAKMLAFLNATGSDERMARSLSDTADSAKTAFCHIAYALGALSTEKSKAALEEFITGEEPWFRVDAAGSLACSKRDDVLPDLAKAMFSHHALSDYAAVAIATHRQLLEFLQNDNPLCQNGGFALALNLVQAAGQTFNDEVVTNSQIAAALPLMLKLCQESPSPLRIHSLLKISDWQKLNDTADDASWAQVQVLSNSEEMKDLILTRLSTLSDAYPDGSESDLETRSAIFLAGKLQIKESVDVLLAALAADPQYGEEIIECLQHLAELKAAVPLVQLARKLVDAKERSDRTVSAQPVVEDDEQKTKLYWMILKTLGKLPAPAVVLPLIEACSDYAPDKREQALSSLLSVYLADNSLVTKSSLHAALERGLSDRNAAVRAVALKGAGEAQALEFLGLIIDALNAPEMSVSRHSQEALSYLWSHHCQKVRAALEDRIAKEHDTFRKKKISNLFDSLKAR